MALTKLEKILGTICIAGSLAFVSGNIPKRYEHYIVGVTALATLGAMGKGVYEVLIAEQIRALRYNMGRKS